MKHVEAVRLWNVLCKTPVGSHEEYKVEPLGYVAISSGIPTSVDTHHPSRKDGSDYDFRVDERTAVAKWLRMWADAIVSEDGASATAKCPSHDDGE